VPEECRSTVFQLEIFGYFSVECGVSDTSRVAPPWVNHGGLNTTNEFADVLRVQNPKLPHRNRNGRFTSMNEPPLTIKGKTQS
jgi:hypothetical protein